MTPAKESIELAGQIGDPANKYYRYPVARWILPAFLATPITPNQVTVAHTVIGISGAWFVAQGTSRGLLIAFFLLEIRMILDCLDGVLARARNLSSPYGRSLDEFCDGTAFLALAIGMAMHMKKCLPLAPHGIATVLLLLVGIFMAWGGDFYQRKFTSALRDGRDIIFEELLEKTRRFRSGHHNLIDRFGYFFDWAQVLVLQPSQRTVLAERIDSALAGKSEIGSVEVDRLLRNHRTREFRNFLRWMNLMCGDNLIGGLHVAILIGGLSPAIWSGHIVFLGEVAAILFGLLAIIATIVSSRSFLSRRPRDAGMPEGAPSPVHHAQESKQS